MRIMLVCLTAAALSSAGEAAAQTWRDASATLPPKEAPGHTMNAQAVDVDADGDLDLILAMEYRANRLLLNDGRGGFTDASDRLPRNLRDSEEIAVLPAPNGGPPSFAVANEDDLRPELYLAEGGARRDASATVAVRVKANGVTAFDADADGHLDLFFAGDKVSVLMMGQGDGRFADESLARLPDTFNAAQDAKAADLDGDGDLDLVIGAEDRNQIYFNDGQGRFAVAAAPLLPRAAAPEETREVAVADFDGDGDVDLYFANVALWNPRANPQDRLLLNDGQGVFTDATATWLPADADSTLSALPIDWDGDGDWDLITTGLTVTASGLGPGPVRAWRNTGASFQDATTEWLPADLTAVGFDLVAEDFDGDGARDLFLAARGGPDRLFLTTPAP